MEGLACVSEGHNILATLYIKPHNLLPCTSVVQALMRGTRKPCWRCCMACGDGRHLTLMIWCCCWTLTSFTCSSQTVPLLFKFVLGFDFHNVCSKLYDPNQCDLMQRNFTYCNLSLSLIYISLDWTHLQYSQVTLHTDVSSWNGCLYKVSHWLLPSI